ncbi:PAS domain-containing protein [Hyunsoonleella rubra]|uniref:PAS domain-containing protein n=1 Tax=Hyunsoonleella rubra TaxID=1737062 RepID=A0ABW5TFP1_9FLAO
MKHNLYKMMGLDIYLSSLSKSEYKAVSAEISNTSKVMTPLMSWDVYSQGYIDTLNESERLQDIAKVKSYAKHLNWKNTMDSIFENEVFQAIIITDLNQNIVWVNKGFSKMTGYAKNEVLHKTPKMLQGAETSITARRNIKKKIALDVPFREIITNYKKSGEPYECEVKIFPLYSRDNNKTHFIALEGKVG